MPPVADPIHAKFLELCATPSDIHEHLPVLKEYADQCESVTEFGTRGCVSLYAFLASNAKTVVAYDILNVAVPACPKLQFINADVLTVEIEPTDLLFVDSKHTGPHVREELRLHAGKVRKFLILHDTQFFGATGEDGGEGLLQPIAEFLTAHPEWEMELQLTNNNGLTILKRV